MKGRLVDLINLFGRLGGFDFLKKRICEGELTVNILSFLLRPFGLCSSFLTERVRNDYIIAIVDKSIEFINSLNDDLLKKEATTDSRSETFSSIMKVWYSSG
ncbi:PREDICTED: probable ubiquitin carboxyl-terminal hydrolase FAF-X [Amphimedon queenslandica]|uniref:Uncharacterized protein n=1 Tax=Amphimedon queenslandica TaxID=400682 RepID=A0AAN0K3K7_AMPQE|nr:PREDICTED: probable ubiquitin carboxyl-terminal hydrolase FAF-X [Amphimedon queenslandica]|eukprot:XP_019863880.1 PREDICTED: probable ubiquitin carboxyl-terminal hydrolase FAF-X [Amphimedon queenslandica]